MGARIGKMIGGFLAVFVLSSPVLAQEDPEDRYNVQCDEPLMPTGCSYPDRQCAVRPSLVGGHSLDARLNCKISAQTYCKRFYWEECCQISCRYFSGDSGADGLNQCLDSCLEPRLFQKYWVIKRDNGPTTNNNTGSDSTPERTGAGDGGAIIEPASPAVAAPVDNSTAPLNP